MLSTITIMKTNQNHPLRNMRNLAATVRAMVEQQYASRFEPQPRLIRLALNEAEAIAWDTGFPHLIFPTLAWEKVRDMAEWQTRRRQIRDRDPMLALAA